MEFVKNKYHKPEGNTSLEVSRFTSINTGTDTQYDLLSNYSRNGYLLPKHHKINYFLKIQNPFWEKEKEEFIRKLDELAEILLIFELDLYNISSLHPFIFNDKED